MHPLQRWFVILEVLKLRMCSSLKLSVYKSLPECICYNLDYFYSGGSTKIDQAVIRIQLTTVVRDNLSLQLRAKNHHGDYRDTAIEQQSPLPLLIQGQLDIQKTLFMTKARAIAELLMRTVMVVVQHDSCSGSTAIRTQVISEEKASIATITAGTTTDATITAATTIASNNTAVASTTAKAANFTTEAAIAAIATTGATTAAETTTTSKEPTVASTTARAASFKTVTATASTTARAAVGAVAAITARAATELAVAALTAVAASAVWTFEEATIVGGTKGFGRERATISVSKSTVDGRTAQKILVLFIVIMNIVEVELFHIGGLGSIVLYVDGYRSCEQDRSDDQGPHICMKKLKLIAHSAAKTRRWS
ncbi:hypothetical protein FOZ63_033982 [Perkinsus olseni]|uniref:Uncharacterized protein n=1 Tax=Perkinsus olseni TaxID=32597 RepID=A0A7J6UKU8_PEROL|nr:hypothetical protein FOZ63_033982 [Perkinsus olseni]